MQEELPTIEIPQAQFAQHIIDLAREGPVQWHVNEEIREDTGFRDVFNTDTYFNHTVDEDTVELHFETTGTVSEQVARRTRSHPAEYEHHDVTIHGTIVMPWTNEQLPETETYVEQEGRPTEPPNPPEDKIKGGL